MYVLQAIRASAAYAPVRRRRLERLTRSDGYLPRWDALLAGREADWAEARARAGGPRVLMATGLGMHSAAVTVDTALAVALTLRGAAVEFLLCDAALPGCQMADHDTVPSEARMARVGPRTDLCTPCQGGGERALAPLGLPVRRYGDLAGPVAPVPDPLPDPALEEQAVAGALRYFGRETLNAERFGAAVLARYRAAALRAQAAVEALLDARPYHAVVAHHGIYAPQGVVAEVARRRGVPLVAWNRGYRAGTLVLEHGRSYHFGMLDEPEAAWSGPLTTGQDAALDRYLAERATGREDWIRFQTEDAPTSEGGADADPRPMTLLAPSVVWDARLHYPGLAFEHMADWLVETVRRFAHRPDRRLVVRAHPGEVKSSPRARDRMGDALAAAFGDRLPENVRFVPPEDPANTYALARRAETVLIYNSKLGVELAAAGKPVIVAGDAWIRGKGFSFDAADRAGYLALLDDPATRRPLGPEARERARRYAWHFFFRRYVPVGVFADPARSLKLRDDVYDRLRPGADAGVDLVCRGVLEGAPFHFEGPPEAFAAAL